MRGQISENSAEPMPFWQGFCLRKQNLRLFGKGQTYVTLVILPKVCKGQWRPRTEIVSSHFHAGESNLNFLPPPWPTLPIIQKNIDGRCGGRRPRWLPRPLPPAHHKSGRRGSSCFSHHRAEYCPPCSSRPPLPQPLPLPAAGGGWRQAAVTGTVWQHSATCTSNLRASGRGRRRMSSRRGSSCITH